jgi:hypothetical protein
MRPTVFERLQEDTEKRLRSRLENYSIPRKFALRTMTPSVSSTGRLRIVSRSNSRLENEAEMTFQPCINQNSLKIFNNKYLKKAKLEKNKQVFYTDDDYSNPAEFDGLQVESFGRDKEEFFQKNDGFAGHFTSQKFETKPKPLPTSPVDHIENRSSSKHSKNVSSRRSQVNTLSQQQLITSTSESIPVTDRKYVPHFSKPFDLSKILSKTLPKKNPPSSKPPPKTEVRPLLRPISDSSLKTEDTAVYQKIVQDRLSKLKELKKNSRKITN